MGLWCFGQGGQVASGEDVGAESWMRSGAILASEVSVIHLEEVTITRA